MEYLNSNCEKRQTLLQRNVGVLYRQWQIALREIEHIKHNRLCSTTLAMVYCINHLHHYIACVQNGGLAVLANDFEFALHKHTVIH